MHCRESIPYHVRWVPMPMIRISCVSDHITVCADDSYELYAMIHVHSVLPCIAVRDHIIASYDS